MQVTAVAYDNPIPGFQTNNTINLRLWAAKPDREFDLEAFNTGDYVQVCFSSICGVQGSMHMLYACCGLDTTACLCTMSHCEGHHSDSRVNGLQQMIQLSVLVDIAHCGSEV